MSRFLASRALVIASVLVGAALLACSGGGGREIEIVAGAEGCTPTEITVERGEALSLVVRNEAGGDRELEGIDGTRLEEVLVPDGRSRTIDYTMPSDSDLQKLKCYIPGGPTTVITLTTGAADASGAGGAAAPAGGTAGTASGTGSSGDADPDAPTVSVELDEWSVSPDVAEVAAGRVRFVASNRSAGLIHELAVLAIGADGQRREVAEAEDINPGASAEFVADLEPGMYELACLIAPGEAGSTVDHYQEGMHTRFVVH